MHSAYLLILTAGALERSVMTAGNNGVGIYSVILDPRNGSVGVCDIAMNSRNRCIGVPCEFLLEAKS